MESSNIERLRDSLLHNHPLISKFYAKVGGSKMGQEFQLILDEILLEVPKQSQLWKKYGGAFLFENNVERTVLSPPKRKHSQEKDIELQISLNGDNESDPDEVPISQRTRSRQKYPEAIDELEEPSEEEEPPKQSHAKHAKRNDLLSDNDDADNFIVPDEEVEQPHYRAVPSDTSEDSDSQDDSRSVEKEEPEDQIPNGYISFRGRPLRTSSSLDDELDQLDFDADDKEESEKIKEYSSYSQIPQKEAQFRLFLWDWFEIQPRGKGSVSATDLALEFDEWSRRTNNSTFDLSPQTIGSYLSRMALQEPKAGVVTSSDGHHFRFYILDKKNFPPKPSF